MQSSGMLALVEVKLFLVGDRFDDETKDAGDDGEGIKAVEWNILSCHACCMPRHRERECDGCEEQVLCDCDEEDVEYVVACR